LQQLDDSKDKSNLIPSCYQSPLIRTGRTNGRGCIIKAGTIGVSFVSDFVKKVIMKRLLGVLAFVLSWQSADLAQTSQQIQAVRNEHLSHWGYSTVSWNPSWQPVSVEQVTELEQQLSRNPEGDETRVRLLVYYFHNDQRQQRVDLVCWLIEHHPDSTLLSLDIAWILPNSISCRTPSESHEQYCRL
jgi:hypothetical protein